MTDFDAPPPGGETADSWWPEGYDLPAFRVKRETYSLSNGGDWTRGSSVTTLAHTALRYPSTTEYDPEDSAKGLLYVRPFDYHTTEIRWGWPNQYADTWVEVALVRSAFGHPSTPRDGDTVFRSMRAEFEASGAVLVAPPIVYDQPLPSGHWYYYTLFFRTNPIDWVVAMSDACLLPNDYMHREHMWNAVPPHYQRVDGQMGDNHLRQFLTIFGFVMDNTREFVEGMVDLHYIDKTPVPLLKGVGANFGLPYEAGMGDIRYRGLVANAPNAQRTRGTALGLKQVIEAVSKYEVGITGSQTLMMYPDDSEFYTSTGNWGGPHPDTVVSVESRMNPATSSARLTTVAGCYIEGPDLAATTGAKSLVIEMDCSLDSWTGATSAHLAGQSSGGSTTSWNIQTINTGYMAFSASSTGSSSSNYASDPHGFAAGSRHVVGGTWTGDTGTNSTFQFKQDGADLGALKTNVTRFTTGLFNSPNTVRIGRDSSDVGGLTGNVYSFKLWADGVLVASPNFTRMAAGQTTVTDAQGNVWTLQGAATVANPSPLLLTWDKIYLSRINKTAPYGRGVMRMYTKKADETLPVLILCGDSRIRGDGNLVITRTDGLPIDATHPAPDTVPGVVGRGFGVVNNTYLSLAMGQKAVAGAKLGQSRVINIWQVAAGGTKPLGFRDALPLEAGISVVTGVPYGMSAWIQAPEKDINVQLCMVWVGPTGSPKEVVDVTLGPVVGTASFSSPPTQRDWHQYTLNGQAPAAIPGFAEARYMIPGIYISGRIAHTTTLRSAGVDVCGVMAYALGKQDSAVAITPPDKYLTLGDPNEKIGAPKSGFDGFIIGSPKK